MQKVTLFPLRTCAVCKKVKKFRDTLAGGGQWLMTRELSKHNPRAAYPTFLRGNPVTS